METVVIVGIFTLAGVAIGAGFNYLFLERSRRQERKDQAEENTLNATSEFFISLTQLHERIRQFRRNPTNTEKGKLSEAYARFFKNYVNMGKASLRMTRYVKKGPIVSSLVVVRKKLLNLDVENPHSVIGDFTKLKDNQLYQKLDIELNQIYDDLNKLRDALLAD